MNLTELRAMARLEVPQADTTIITDANQLIIFNNGIKDIVRRTKCLPTAGTFDATLNQPEYDLSAIFDDYLCPLDEGYAYHYDGTDYELLDCVTIGWLDQNYEGWKENDTDRPERYFILGDTFRPHPVPEATVSNGFTLYYAAKPPELDGNTNIYPFGGDTLITRLEPYHDIILAYYKWKAYEVLYGIEKPELVSAKGVEYFNRVSIMANEIKEYTNKVILNSEESRVEFKNYAEDMF